MSVPAMGGMATTDNNLAVRNPDLAAEWDVGKNGDLTVMMSYQIRTRKSGEV